MLGYNLSFFEFFGGYLGVLLGLVIGVVKYFDGLQITNSGWCDNSQAKALEGLVYYFGVFGVVFIGFMLAGLIVGGIGFVGRQKGFA